MSNTQEGDMLRECRPCESSQISCTPDSRSISEVVRGRVVENEPLARYTAIGVGGPADLLVEVADEDDLCALMRCVSTHGLPWTILGDGTNVLISDQGIRGIVIRLGEALCAIDVDGQRMTAGSCAAISKVADVAAEHNLAGLEGVGTVPGTVGGAIVMNAGTHRGYIDEVVTAVSVVGASGEKMVLSREDCGFTYRSSRFQVDRSLIITSVEFTLRSGDGEAIRRHLEDVRKHRLETQPRGRSAGCFFKNPPNSSAGKLIEAAGGKGMREGGAVVSDTHANFIINENNATAADIRRLAERVRELVREKHGIELEYEVRILGEWQEAAS